MFALTMPSWSELYLLVRKEWLILINTDFGQINYSETTMAAYAALIIILVVLLKFWWWVAVGREKHARAQSGLFNSNDDEPNRNLPARLLGPLFKLLLILPLAAILTALTDPSFTLVEEREGYVMSRVQAVLFDDSGSMNSPFKNSGKKKVGSCR